MIEFKSVLYLGWGAECRFKSLSFLFVDKIISQEYYVSTCVSRTLILGNKNQDDRREILTDGQLMILRTREEIYGLASQKRSPLISLLTENGWNSNFYFL